MTLPATTRRAGPFSGNGVTTAFPFTFKVFAASDISVIKTSTAGVDSVLVLNSAYSVALNVDQDATPGGTITYPITGTPLASGEKLSAVGALPFDQTLDLPSGGNFSPVALENALDRVEMQLQQTVEQANRAITLPASSSGGGMLPDAATRANKLLSFDNSGNVQTTLPITSDATVLAIDLANNTSSVKGSSLIGYLPGAAVGATGTTVQAKLRERISTSDFLTFQAAYDATPEGGTLFVKGIVNLTSPTTLTRRVSVVCPGPDDALYVNVGSANNALTFAGDASGMNNIALQLNVYGPASACNNAVVLSRVDRSNIALNVRAGALAYAVVLDGVLQNKINVYSSTNWVPPVSSYGNQVDHICIKRNDTYGVAPNANTIYVLLEGCRNGITTPGLSEPGVIPVSEGANDISGQIQGITGRAINWYQSTGLNIHDLWLEANGLHSVFNGCRSLRIGPGVQGVSPTYPLGRQLQFLGCQGVVVDGFHYGQLLFDAMCSLPVIRNALVYTDADIITPDGFFNGGVTYPIASLSDATIAFGGAGVPSMENIHTNPFLDIWYWNGSALQPQDVTGTNCTLAQGAIAPSSYSDTNNTGATPNLSCTLTAAGVNNGVYFNLPTRYINQLYNRWMSFSIPVFLQTGSANARIYVNGTLVSTVTTTNTWVMVRGSAIVPALGNFSLWITRHDGTNFVASNAFAVGGVSICYGPHSPKNIVAGPNRGAPASAVRAFRSSQFSISVGADTIIPYDTVETDLISEYNNTTGVFTAKYSGLYNITGGGETTLVAWNEGNQFFCAITVNGTKRAVGERGYQWVTTFGSPNKTMYKTSYPSTVIYLTAGSTVSITGFSDRPTDAYNFAIFGAGAGTGGAASTFISIGRVNSLLVI